MTQSLHESTPSLEQRLEQEPQSPLFARLASHYLQAGRAQDALRICDEGLATYPFYSTGHLIKGKVLLELKMLAEAKREFEVVHILLPTSELASQLYSSIDLGPSTDLTAAVEPMAAEGYAPPAQEETAPTEAGLQEVVTEEPVVTQPEQVEPQAMTAEGPFGAQQEEAPPQPFETPRVEEPYSFGVETPAVESQEQSQPEVADYGFGASVETAPAVESAPEVSAAPLMEHPESYAEFKAELTEETPAAEPAAIEPMAEGLATEPRTVEPTTTEESTAEAEQVPNWFEAFSQLEHPPTETVEPTAEAHAEEEDPFAAFGAEAESPTTEAPIEGEAYEEFAARKRMELFGTEDTLSLDEYLRTPSGDQPTAGTDHIGELAEKLKTPKKITPVINYAEKAPRPASEADTAAGSGFVTPTLAEIYVKQGWYDDAIKAYRALVINKPAEREKFEKRIAEIEEMKKQQQ